MQDISSTINRIEFELASFLVCNSMKKLGHSERKKTVKDDREAGLKGFFRAAPVGSGLVRDRVLLDVNERFCEMVGYSAEELKGKDARIVYPSQAEYEYVGREKYAQIRKKGTGTVQTRMQRKDGSIIEVILSSTALDPSNLSKGFVFTVLDITERRKAEEEMRKSESQYRSTIDSMDDGLHVIDKDLKVVLLNKTCAEWAREFGFEGEAFGRSVFELFPFLPGRIKEEYKKVFDTAETLVTEEATRIGGRDIITEISKIPVIEGSEVVRVITIIRDVTERRKKEHQIQQYQEKLKVMASELMNAEERVRRRIAVGLHDGVGQKLALAKLNLQAVRKTLSKVPIEESLDEILVSINETIKDIRSLTFELASPLLYEIGLVAAVKQYLREEVEGKYGLKSILTVDKSLKTLDKQVSISLYRIICELLMNVFKHAGAETVEIDIRQIERDVVVRVKDDGAGFDVLSYSALSKNDKTHFGLFSIRERLEQMGGELEIDSVHNSGTTVTVRTPVKQRSRRVNVKGR
jgi:PAS domain S-box-containing protein